MDKIKVYRVASTSGKSSPKGSLDNPYTVEEYEEYLDSGKDWPGGYVKDMGYIAADTIIVGSYPSDDSWWDSWEDSSWSDPWSSSGSSEDSSGSSSGSGGGSQGGSVGGGSTAGSVGGGTTGGQSGGWASPSSNIDKAFPELPTRQTDGNCVRILSTRLAKTGVSTLSKFNAVAYDANGNMIASTKLAGYFLERAIDYDKATVSGQNAAILQGDYAIIPGESWQKYAWYLCDVPGRAGIAIHAGNTYQDSTGCLLVGNTYAYDKNSNEYTIGNSRLTLSKLSDLLKEYGYGNIRIQISEDF